MTARTAKEWFKVVVLWTFFAIVVVQGVVSFVEYKYVRLRVPGVDEPSLWLNRNAEEAMTELRELGYNAGAEPAWMAESYLRTNNRITFATDQRRDLDLYTASKITSPDWWPIYVHYSWLELYVDQKDSIVGFYSQYTMQKK